MYKNKKILAVVPARGGSKGIPRKSIKPLCGKPLIYHTLEKLQKSEYIDRVIVTSEDDEILNISKKLGVQIHKRTGDLARDETPLDPVIYDVCEQNIDYDYIITLQPTSPLLRLETINKSIKKFIDEGKNSLMSLREETHLYWKENETGDIVADFTERVNRQFLPKKYVETGAIIGVKSSYFLENKVRLDISNCSFIITANNESIDIDTDTDWLGVEALLNNKPIGINLIGNVKNGLGHVYRQLEIAFHLSIKPIFFVKTGNELAKNKIQNNFYGVKEYQNTDELLQLLKDNNISILLNDILDTSESFIKNIKRNGVSVINFEDLGSGKKYADYTINELYEFTGDNPNILHGYKYVTIRSDVRLTEKKEIKKEVENIIISCGGTDPSNLTQKYLDAIQVSKYNKNIAIIIGPGYSHKKQLLEKIKDTNIHIYEDVKNMGDLLNTGDLILTSNGRTIFEITTLGIPAISVSQNEQEMHHTFANFSGCIKSLGLVGNVTKENIAKEIDALIGSYQKRQKIHKEMLSYKLGDGIHNILQLISNL